MGEPRNRTLASAAALLLTFACSSTPPEEDDDADMIGTGGTTGDPGSGGAASMSGGSVGVGGTEQQGSGGGISEGPCGAQPVSSQFTLRWEDEFDSFDESRWNKNGHTFAENLAQFSPDAVVTEDGYLKIFLTQEQTGDRNYRGGEVSTEEEFRYGRFDTCVRWGRGGGIVGSFFTYKFGPWNEIDIEYLGGNPVGIQYNVIWDPGGGNQYDPHFDPLELDPADEFHQYSFEWTPGVIRFYVDGELRHVEQDASAQAITQFSTLRMNLWPTDTGFAGDFDPGAIPTESWYDWVRVYDYVP